MINPQKEVVQFEQQQQQQLPFKNRSTSASPSVSINLENHLTRNKQLRTIEAPTATPIFLRSDGTSKSVTQPGTARRRESRLHQSMISAVASAQRKIFASKNMELVNSTNASNMDFNSSRGSPKNKVSVCVGDSKEVTTYDLRSFLKYISEEKLSATFVQPHPQQQQQHQQQYVGQIPEEKAIASSSVRAKYSNRYYSESNAVVLQSKDSEQTKDQVLENYPTNIRRPTAVGVVTRSVRPTSNNNLNNSIEGFLNVSARPSMIVGAGGTSTSSSNSNAGGGFLQIPSSNSSVSFYGDSEQQSMTQNRRRNSRQLQIAQSLSPPTPRTTQLCAATNHQESPPHVGRIFSISPVPPPLIVAGTSTEYQKKGHFNSHFYRSNNQGQGAKILRFSSPISISERKSAAAAAPNGKYNSCQSKTNSNFYLKTEPSTRSDYSKSQLAAAAASSSTPLRGNLRQPASPSPQPSINVSTAAMNTTTTTTSTTLTNFYKKSEASSALNFYNSPSKLIFPKESVKQQLQQQQPQPQQQQQQSQQQQQNSNSQSECSSNTPSPAHSQKKNQESSNNNSTTAFTTASMSTELYSISEIPSSSKIVLPSTSASPTPTLTPGTTITPAPFVSPPRRTLKQSLVYSSSRSQSANKKDPIGSNTSEKLGNGTNSSNTTSIGGANTNMTQLKWGQRRLSNQFRIHEQNGRGFSGYDGQVHTMKINSSNFIIGAQQIFRKITCISQEFLQQQQQQQWLLEQQLLQQLKSNEPLRSQQNSSSQPQQPQQQQQQTLPSLSQFAPIQPIVVPQQQQVSNLRSTRIGMKNYLYRRYNEGMVEKLLAFLEVPAKLDFVEYTKIIDRYLNLSRKEKSLLLFMLFDLNEDGYICHADLFMFLQQERNQMLEVDIQALIRFAQNRLNEIAYFQSDDNDIEKILVKKANLSLTEYKLLKKKGQDLIVPTLVKKDTIYSNCFQIIEHSFKFRLSWQQFEETKHSQMLDKKKNKVKRCEYARDHTFSINFDQFELFIDESKLFPYIYYDLLAYMSLMRFSHIDYGKYDANYYLGFTSFTDEHLQFQSTFQQLVEFKERERQNKTKRMRENQIRVLQSSQATILASKAEHEGIPEEPEM